MKKACKICKKIIETGNICPNCKSGDTTSSFQGTVVVFDIESEIAKKLGIGTTGKYALRV
ncbi:MAG: transcription elongation factor Spt4 [Candidatus Aenigmarchaeota archaeon]|nr:transcription elongation factor Spt4 [Candidatus Aenigmarchaeota archaeon]